MCCLSALAAACATVQQAQHLLTTNNPARFSAELPKAVQLMTNHEDGIIDAEIVEEDHLPARIEPGGTHEGAKSFKAQPREDGRDWPHGPLPERRCRAHSSRTGEPCKNAAIKGSTVCRFHGGAAKQVKANARARLENAADLMAKQLLGIALTAESEAVKLAAIKDALDRGGLKAPSEVVLSQGEAKPYEQVFDAIGGKPEESSPASRLAESLDASRASDHYGPGGNSTESSAQRDLSDPTQPPTLHTQPTPEPDTLRPRTCRDGSRSANADSPVADQQSYSEGKPARQEVHITGLAAIQIANQANRASGALPPLRELESPHKRYRRP